MFMFQMRKNSQSVCLYVVGVMQMSLCQVVITQVKLAWLRRPEKQTGNRHT